MPPVPWTPLCGCGLRARWVAEAHTVHAHAHAHMRVCTCSCAPAHMHTSGSHQRLTTCMHPMHSWRHVWACILPRAQCTHTHAHGGAHACMLLGGPIASGAHMHTPHACMCTFRWVGVSHRFWCGTGKPRQDGGCGFEHEPKFAEAPKTHAGTLLSHSQTALTHAREQAALFTAEAFGLGTCTCMYRERAHKKTMC